MILSTSAPTIGHAGRITANRGTRHAVVSVLPVAGDNGPLAHQVYANVFDHKDRHVWGSDSELLQAALVGGIPAAAMVLAKRGFTVTIEPVVLINWKPRAYHTETHPLEVH